MYRGLATATLVALGIACQALAAEPRVGRFVKYDAGDFVIITSRSANQARRSTAVCFQSGSKRSRRPLP